MAEGVRYGLVLGVKVAVVEVDTLAIVALRRVADVGRVVVGGLGEGVGKFARGVDGAVEDVCDGVAGLFAQ